MSDYPQAGFLTSAHRADQFVADDGAEVAFAGRSNAGKSSAINVIVNRVNFARTSKLPGRTQLINFFSLRPGQRLVDLPGYGYARVPRSLQQHWRDLMGRYFSTRESLAGLFLVMDIRRGLTDFDAQLLDWADQIQCPVHVLLTKSDKLKRGPATDALRDVRRQLHGGHTIQLFSSLKKDGAEQAREQLNLILASHLTRAGQKKTPGAV